jgi:uncharacterized membrane protein
MQTRDGRIVAIDIVRGIAMVLMAIDHVRVYSGVPAGGPDPAVFFTRWITHFVAPAFIFLAGVSVHLVGRSIGRAQLSRYLVTRGLWLVFLELTFIRIAWTFNFDFAHYLLAGVIWVIGWCMVLMSILVHVPRSVSGAFAVAIIALHNLIVVPADPGPLIRIFYVGDAIGPLLILYTIIPWIGVMALGYALGPLLEGERRRTFALRLGIALTAAFVILRFIDRYGDPRHWRAKPSLLSFLATSKYPASLLFLLMTLGPMFLALALFESRRGAVTGVFATFGRVPMFYYLAHIPLIHAAACVVSLIREGRVDPWLFGNHPLAPPPLPAGYMWPLSLLYLVFFICVALLYPLCRWYSAQRPKHRWLRYL